MSKIPEAFPALIQVIKEKFSLPARSNGKAGKKLDLSQVRTYKCLRSPPVAARTWMKLFRKVWELAYKEGLREGRRQATGRLLSAVKETLGTRNNAELARAFQKTSPAITQWKQGKSTPTVTSLQKLLKKRAKLRISILAELSPIDPATRRGAWLIDKEEKKRSKWREQLKGKSGIYIFYDSLGRATYVGKTSAKSNDLFKEIEQRLRTAKLRGVHFRRYLAKLNGNNGLRQGDITRLISVYEIMDIDSVHNIEALLIRAFMNSHLNNSLENFK